MCKEQYAGDYCQCLSDSHCIGSNGVGIKQEAIELVLMMSCLTSLLNQKSGRF